MSGVLDDLDGRDEQLVGNEIIGHGFLPWLVFFCPAFRSIDAFYPIRSLWLESRFSSCATRS
jgi:hypothetical protein